MKDVLGSIKQVFLWFYFLTDYDYWLEELWQVHSILEQTEEIVEKVTGA